MAVKEKTKKQMQDASQTVKVRLHSQVLEIELEGRETLLQKELPALMEFVNQLSAAAVNRSTRLDLLEHSQTAQRLTSALDDSLTHYASIFDQLNNEYEQLDQKFLELLRMLNNNSGQINELRHQLNDLINQRVMRQANYQIIVNRRRGEGQQLDQALDQLQAQQQLVLQDIEKIV
jgi:hypothetical protein